MTSFRQFQRKNVNEISSTRDLQTGRRLGGRGRVGAFVRDEWF